MMTLLFLAQAISKVKEHLEAQVAKNPESKLFCKALGDYMKGFPEQGGKDLKVGIHTLNGAAELLLQGSAFNTLMEAQGAVLYLTKMVKCDIDNNNSNNNHNDISNNNGNFSTKLCCIRPKW